MDLGLAPTCLAPSLAKVPRGAATPRLPPREDAASAARSWRGAAQRAATPKLLHTTGCAQVAAALPAVLLLRLQENGALLRHPACAFPLLATSGWAGLFAEHGRVRQQGGEDSDQDGK